MGTLAILEMILLGLEKGPGIVRAVRDSFASDAEPTVEEIIAKMNAMADPFDADETDPFPIDPDEE